MKDYQIDRIVDSQVDDAVREKAAQFIIVNDGDRDQLLRQVESIFEELQRLAKDLV
jgi:dephospho-CoA kinase